MASEWEREEEHVRCATGGVRKISKPRSTSSTAARGLKVDVLGTDPTVANDRFRRSRHHTLGRPRACMATGHR